MRLAARGPRQRPVGSGILVELPGHQQRGGTPGAHLLSGACINPIAFRKLFPGKKMEELPFFGPVAKESVYMLPNESNAVAVPCCFTVPAMIPTLTEPWLATLALLLALLALRRLRRRAL